MLDFSGARLPVSDYVYLWRWRCAGRRRDGSPCLATLARVRLGPGTVLEVKCYACNYLNRLSEPS